jgi:hypothetical protein
MAQRVPVEKTSKNGLNMNQRHEIKSMSGYFFVSVLVMGVIRVSGVELQLHM